MADTKYRVAFVNDPEAQFEECNGEARPLTEAEYAENQYRACPDHMRAGSKVITFGPPQVQGCAVCGRTDYVDVPYAEYRAYYGNPEMHRYIGTVVQAQTGIGDWQTVASLWRSDFMRDDPALRKVTVTSEGAKAHYYSEAEAVTLPGYFGELAREMLAEAKNDLDAEN